MRIAKLAVLIFGLVGFLRVEGQVVFEPTQNHIYDFLDEMSAEQFIELNSFSRPYSRNLIAQKLAQLDTSRSELNTRQISDLDFYLKDFGKELRVGKDWDRRIDAFYYSDSVFSVTINPIIGGIGMYNENGFRSHRRIGAGFQAKAGGFGFYGSLRDNSVSEVLATPNYLTVLDGQNYKTITEENTSDYNEAIGGITYQWKWGDVGVHKNRIEWGNSTRSANVFSGKAPSYAMISYRLYPVDWLDFQYIHGWLVSEELDSARTYLTPNGTRKIYMNKNIAANYFTIKSNWKVDFTFGNSIVYSDDGLNPVYFIPFMFFKSADHTYNGTGSNELGQNAQLFFDISARVIPSVHLYSSLFIDEISLSNMWDPDQQTNIVSLQVGAKWYNVLPNIHLKAEYTRTNPWTYRHQIESTTFASNQYGLGNYLGENADEVYLELDVHPWRQTSLTISGWYARKGPQHIYEIIDGNANVTGLEFMETVDWEQLALSTMVRYEPWHDVVIHAGITFMSTEGNQAYTPTYLQGMTTTGEFGVEIGF